MGRARRRLIDALLAIMKLLLGGESERGGYPKSKMLRGSQCLNNDSSS